METDLAVFETKRNVIFLLFKKVDLEGSSPNSSMG